jgi:broad specificity phosphatase PhoE
MFGRFFFRFPNGEAGLDVYNRVSSFLATLSRDLLQFQDSGSDMDRLNIVIVTHGLTMRLLLMRYFQLSVEEFEHSFNPQNAKIVVMERIEPTPSIQEEGSGEEGDVAASSLDTPAAKPFFRLQEEAKVSHY